MECSVWRERSMRVGVGVQRMERGGGGSAAYGERSMRVGVGVQRMERRAWGGGGSAAYGEKGMRVGVGVQCLGEEARPADNSQSDPRPVGMFDLRGAILSCCCWGWECFVWREEHGWVVECSVWREEH